MKINTTGAKEEQKPATTLKATTSATKKLDAQSVFEEDSISNSSDSSKMAVLKPVPLGSRKNAPEVEKTSLEPKVSKEAPKKKLSSPVRPKATAKPLKKSASAPSLTIKAAAAVAGAIKIDASKLKGVSASADAIKGKKEALKAKKLFASKEKAVPTASKSGTITPPTTMAGKARADDNKSGN